MLPALVLLLLSRLAGADEEECVRIVLCIGIIMMQQNNIRRTTPFRRTIDFNDARRTMWHYLDSPDRAVPSLAPNRHSSSPIVEIMKSGSEAEFRRMFRLSRTVFAALVVELSPWIKSGRSYNGDQNVTAEAKIAIALYWQAGAVASLQRHGHVLGSLRLRRTGCGIRAATRLTIRRRPWRAAAVASRGRHGDVLGSRRS